MSGNTRSLKANEQKILRLLMDNKGHTFREIAKQVNLNEVSVRRIYNKLMQEDVFQSLHIPNFPLLGYKIMMLQRIYIASPFLIETKNIIRNVLDEWNNCVDCHETYDGKIIARSVWKNAEEFKKAHADFYKKFGTEWLQRENIDMIPLDNSSRLIRIKGIDV
jgi:DNA-binding Lrp family transcriptional regulator